MNNNTLDVECDIDVVKTDKASESEDKVKSQKEQVENETRKKIDNLMVKSYLVGENIGKRTAYNNVLKFLIQNKKQNPQKKLMMLQQWVMKQLEEMKKEIENKDSDTETEDNLVDKE